MGVTHLEGKRTGRPPGAKTASRVRRDILWAYQNLDDPGAKPPSPGAKMWAALARERPARFLESVLKVDTEGRRDAKGDGETEGPRPLQTVRKVFIAAAHLYSRLTRDGSAFLSNLPCDARIVRSETDSWRDGTVFTIHSDTFPPVAEGEPVPELQAEHARAR